MGTQRRAGAQTLRRMRMARGWSWAALAGELRVHARTLRIMRIAAAQIPSIKRTIARWENGTSTPDEQYQVLLGHAYARTPFGAVSLGPGSDFRELLDAFAHMGIDQLQLDELAGSVAASVTDGGIGLLAFVGAPLRAELAAALAAPDRADVPLVDGLGAVNDAVNAQVGSVPFVRLHLAQAAVVDACQHLLRGRQPNPVRARLQDVASQAYALAARLAFETHDDQAALNLYQHAVSTAGFGDLSRRALIRTSQTMVVYYATGDISRARAIADTAVQDARRSPSRLLRARAHALQAEMAARADQPRFAHAALHLAWHDLDTGSTNDLQPALFSKGRLRGFEGICGIFLGEATAAELQLTQSAASLTRPRETVQRAIVLTDRALARLRTGGQGAAETAAAQLHECVDLIAATRARVPAQRLRQVRIELKPWRGEDFVADLDDHIHASFVGL